MAKVSKYQQVVEWVKNRIRTGELCAGDKLESENELSVLFGISRQTIRHALELLVQEDILDRVQGSGTYVKEMKASAEEKLELSKTVTIISTYVDGYIFPRILQSMVKVLEDAGYSVQIMFTNNCLETERRLLLRLLEEKSRNPLIVEPVMSGIPNPNCKYYRRLKARGIPILFFHSYYPDLDIPHISMNDEMVGRIATEYLISHGHTKIAGIFKSDDGQGHRRYKGYLKALIHAGIAIREERICWIDTGDVKHFSDIAKKVGQRLTDCTACVCYNDEVAHELTKLQQNGTLVLPEDFSVIGVDNSDLARLNAVPLTSVAHPMEALGQKAAEGILRLIQNPDASVTYEFPINIEERDSVRQTAAEFPAKILEQITSREKE